MIILNKCQLDDELGFHDQETYDKMIYLHFQEQRLKQVLADYNTETWGYEPLY